MFTHTNELLDFGDSLGIPCADLLIYLDGKEVYRTQRGVRDEAGTPMRGNERYNIYSCSKLFTCVAALRLIEEGKLSLDDELALYLPAFGDMRVLKNGSLIKAENRITVSQLFTMTAGLSYDTGSEEIKAGRLATDGKAPTLPMMDYIAKMPLAFEPGTDWRYSLCHDVLAAVVEVVSGHRFGDYVKKIIFDPLGMKDTTFLLPEEEVQDLCAQYRCLADGTYQNVGRQIQSYKFGSEYESGGAGAISTVSDYIRFLEGLRTDKLIKPKTKQLMLTDHLTKKQMQRSFWGAKGYTYGLGVRMPQADSLRTDYGWGGAAGAYAAIDEKNGISLYYAQHVLTSPNRDVRKDLIEAAKLDLGFDAFRADMWKGTGSHLA